MNIERGPANESIHVAVVGSIWGFGYKTNGTVIDGSPLAVAKAAATLPVVHTKHETIQNDIIQNIIRQEQLKDRTTYFKKKAPISYISMHTHKLSSQIRDLDVPRGVALSVF